MANSALGVPGPVSDTDIAQLIVAVDDIALRLPPSLQRSKLQGLKDMAERVSGLSQAVLLGIRMHRPIDAVRCDAELLCAAFGGVLLLSRGGRVAQHVLASVRLGQSLTVKLCAALRRLEAEAPLESFYPIGVAPESVAGY